jgi:xylitol oxidase
MPGYRWLMALTNWAGNYSYRAHTVHAPSSIAELQEIVRAAPRVRVLGSRHSFTDLADSAELLTFDRMSPDLLVDRGAMTASFGSSMRYGELAQELAREGLALANLASLPDITVAGAVSTATHGSGDRNGNLAAAVAGLEIVTSEGDLVTAVRGDSDFDGLVVGLGAIGALTRITLDVEPTYQVRQRVFERLGWEALFDHFDAVTSSGYSVSVFTRWGETADQVWVKHRVSDDPEAPNPELFGAAVATEHRHPILGLDPVNCTPQLGVPGPWFERLPHFRIGFTPSAGAEIQSEYFVSRRHAVPAMEAVLGLRATIQPLLQVSELRTIAADSLWMSPQYHQDTIAIHFTWTSDEAVERALVDLEQALAPPDSQRPG